MRVIDADDIHRLLDFPSLIDALRAMFRAGCEVPLRHHHRIAARVAEGTPGTLMMMPAWQPGGSLGIKIVTVFPDNARRPDNALGALPSVHGTYLLLDGATGMPIALIDGTALTLRRTAAASALAAGFLARPDSAVPSSSATGMPVAASSSR
jgi:alanine dehydrogenase